MAADPHAAVAEALDLHDEMAERAKLGRDLLGGTRKMRARGETWLPRKVREAEPAYEARLAGSFLEPIFEESVTEIADAPFEREIETSDEIPDAMVKRLGDVDREGHALEVFARDVYWDGIVDGLAHILVDMPQLPPRRSRAEDEALGAVPYWTRYAMADVRRWYSEPRPEGGKRLTQVHLREKVRRREDRWGVEEVERVRVLYASGNPWAPAKNGAGEGERGERETTTWEVWEETRSEDGRSKRWLPVDSGEMAPLTEIPLVTFYTHETGFLTARPPLEPVAWINLAHWQSSSMQRHILDFQRFGLLFGRALHREKEGAPIEIGPSRLVEGHVAHSDLKAVQTAGSGVEAGERDLERLEQRGRSAGREPLSAQGGAPETATGRAIDEARGSRSARAWARNLEDALNQALDFSAKFLGVEDGGSATIFKEFGLSLLSEATLKALETAAMTGKLSDEDYLEQLKARGVFRGDPDVGEMIARARRQAPGATGPGLDLDAEPGA